MTCLNPDNFIITRKRKKYKFALFANSPLCFEFGHWQSDWPVDVIEVGAGTGQFLVELARRHPEQNFVAIDVKADRLQKGAREAESEGLSNVRFLRARADQVEQLFSNGSLTSIWLTFSDPFPKKRNQGRRMTHPNFLKKYHRLLKDNGALLIKHDNAEFFNWTLEKLVEEKWRIDELNFDLHDSELSEDYKILTPYEIRWLSDGRITKFVKSIK